MQCYSFILFRPQPRSRYKYFNHPLKQIHLNMEIFQINLTDKLKLQTHIKQRILYQLSIHSLSINIMSKFNDWGDAIGKICLLDVAYKFRWIKIILSGSTTILRLHHSTFDVPAFDSSQHISSFMQKLKYTQTFAIVKYMYKIKSLWIN